MFATIGLMTWTPWWWAVTAFALAAWPLAVTTAYRRFRVVRRQIDFAHRVEARRLQAQRRAVIAQKLDAPDHKTQRELENRVRELEDKHVDQAVDLDALLWLHLRLALVCKTTRQLIGRIHVETGPVLADIGTASGDEVIPRTRRELLVRARLSWLHRLEQRVRVGVERQACVAEMLRLVNERSLGEFYDDPSIDPESMIRDIELYLSAVDEVAECTEQPSITRSNPRRGPRVRVVASTITATNHAADSGPATSVGAQQRPLHRQGVVGP